MTTTSNITDTLRLYTLWLVYCLLGISSTCMYHHSSNMWWAYSWLCKETGYFHIPCYFMNECIITTIQKHTWCKWRRKSIIILTVILTHWDPPGPPPPYCTDAPIYIILYIYIGTHIAMGYAHSIHHLHQCSWNQLTNSEINIELWIAYSIFMVTERCCHESHVYTNCLEFVVCVYFYILVHCTSTVYKPPLS